MVLFSMVFHFVFGSWVRRSNHKFAVRWVATAHSGPLDWNGIIWLVIVFHMLKELRFFIVFLFCFTRFWFVWKRRIDFYCFLDLFIYQEGSRDLPSAPTCVVFISLCSTCEQLSHGGSNSLGGAAQILSTFLQLKRMGKILQNALTAAPCVDH